jgi:protein-S-isoprenylcysteine O-methyltransferase Ste14
MAKEKSWKDIISALALGELLLSANILQNVFITHEPKIVALKMAGLFIFLIAVILWPIPYFALRKHGDISAYGSYMATTKLVTKGIYGIIRHPQYLIFMLLNIGVALINHDIFSITLSVASIVFIMIGIKDEEQQLVNQFGSEYINYMKKVPSFSPLRNLFRSK